MRVLALDLAIGTIGWAVVDAATFSASGQFSLPASDPRRNRADVGLARARSLAARVLDLDQRWQPDWLAYEYPDTPRSKFAGGTHVGGGALQEFQTMQGLGLAEGILVGLAGELMATRSVRLLAISTTEERQLLLGTPYGSKEKIRAALEHKYGCSFGHLSLDETDALAVGVTALHVLQSGPVTVERHAPIKTTDGRTFTRRQLVPGVGKRVARPAERIARQRSGRTPADPS